MGHRYLQLLVSVGSCLVLPFAWSATNPELTAPGATTEAIWQIQHFDLHFRAAKGRYHSCSTLHTKITGIMEAIGAGAVIVNIACGRGALVDDTFARIATALPIAASEENIRAVTTYKTEQRMIARIQQTELPTAETIERFPAEWETVTLTSIRSLRLGPEDCDLLHDMQQQVFPHVQSVRVVRKRLSCGSPNLHPARPVLVVEALRKRNA